MGPLLYLTLCSLRNRMRVRLKRLKEPRYLLGMIVGIAYFWFMFWRPRLSRQGVAAAGVLAAFSGARLPVELAVAAFLFLLCATAWIPGGRKRPALNFTQSDVQFLFPAPLTRKELIRYKLLRSQSALLVSSAFTTIVFRPSSLAHSWMFFAGTALTMNLLNLHLTGVSLSRESLGKHGFAGFARQWFPLAIVGGAALAVIWSVAMDWSTLLSLNGKAFVDELVRLGTNGVAGLVLWPFRAVVRLPLSETPVAFLSALPLALLILALNYVWVIRSDARFEEASAELAEKIALIRKGRRASAPKAAKLRAGAPTPFRLSLEGRAETAIFWKNLIMLGRYASLKTLLRLVVTFIVIFIFAGGRGGGGSSSLFGWVCLMIFVFTMLLGAQIARNDLRQDLVNMAVLKTWPVDGATIVRGEVMAPAALLTSIAWLSAMGAIVFAKGLGLEHTWIAGALLLVPGIILMQLLVQNALAVMWPSWVMTGPSRARGIDIMGGRLIMLFGLLLVLIVAILPAAVVAGVTGYGWLLLSGNVAVIVPAIAADAVLFAEALLVSQAIGKMLDRRDVSAIDAQE